MRAFALAVAFWAASAVCFAEASIYSYNYRCSSSGCANYVRLAVDGVGDLLIFPFIYAGDGVYTRLFVVNTSERFGAVALVTLKSGGCSEILANFLIYLMPSDSWSGLVQLYKGKASLVSYDDSIIAGKNVGSYGKPVVIQMKVPSNPSDTATFGYAEVKTLAYVDTAYVDPDNYTITFNAVMREKGYTEPHLFMQWLYQEGKNKFADVAYRTSNQTELFTGIIFPADRHRDFVKNPVVKNGLVNREFEDGILMGREELVVSGYGISSLQAVAVKDYIMLGDDVLGDGYDYSRDFYTHYKVKMEEGAYLDAVGYTGYLDTALAKKSIFFPYYSNKIDSYAVIFFVYPTKQFAYDPKTASCVATKHTSDVWQSSGVLETEGLDVVAFSAYGLWKKCAYFPCVWEDTAVFGMFSDSQLFDPFLYQSGWVKVLFSSQDDGYMEKIYPGGTEKASWADVRALPVVAVGAYITREGFSLFYPAFRQPFYTVYTVQKGFEAESQFSTPAHETPSSSTVTGGGSAGGSGGLPFNIH